MPQDSATARTSRGSGALAWIRASGDFAEDIDHLQIAVAAFFYRPAIIVFVPIETLIP